MNNMPFKEYEEVKKETALEIMEIFKSKNLSITLIDDMLEYTKRCIHNNAHLQFRDFGQVI